MKYYVMTLGCQMNISDSQRIETKLKELGYKSASEKEADLVVVNSCSVRQKGIDRIWGGIKKWRAGKKKILITGCVLESDRKKYAERDIFFLDIKDLNNLQDIIKVSSRNCYKQACKAGLQMARQSRELYSNFSSIDNGLDYFNIEPTHEGKIAYIPIMTGCDNFCSYCAVPYTRGREVSRSIDDIIKECQKAIDSGFKEIWLLGQNVNSYREIDRLPLTDNRKKNRDFIELLKKVDNLESDFKFNFISSNPQDMTDELIDCFAELKKWTKELHLAIQSGDDEILRKMNRKCTNGQFLALISKLKNQISNIKISTDIIVGFPTETKEQFENTVKACEEIGFWKAYVNQYSPREGTVSAKMVDDVPTSEKKRRWLKLDDLINKKSADKLPKSIS